MIRRKFEEEICDVLHCVSVWNIFIFKTYTHHMRLAGRRATFFEKQSVIVFMLSTSVQLPEEIINY